MLDIGFYVAAWLFEWALWCIVPAVLGMQWWYAGLMRVHDVIKNTNLLCVRCSESAQNAAPDPAGRAHQHPYTVNHKKVELFCFCNNFVKYKRNWIIFGMFLA